MNFGIALTSAVPVRKEGRESSEMTSQLLFGETFKILRIVDDWIEIKTDYDNYSGWISDNSVELMNDDDYEKLIQQPTFIVKDKYKEVKKNGTSLLIPAGSELRKNIQIKQKKIDIKYSEKDELKSVSFSDIAIQFRESPYLWGGKTGFGCDCSGFVQIVFKCLGIYLPRDTKDQLNAGKEVKSFSNLMAGDILLLERIPGKISHVGIALSESTIIHSSGKVRIDKLDSTGIYNEDLQAYTHKNGRIRRIITG